MKKFIWILPILLVGYHYYHLHQVEKRTALAILDNLRSMELEVLPDVDQGDEEKIYFSPRNYARRLAIIDCETMVYEKYRLWK